MEFFSFINQSHLFNPREIDQQITSTLISLTLSYFRKNSSQKMNVLQIFGSWDQEMDL